MAELLRIYLRATRQRRAIVPLPVVGQAVRAGAVLNPDRAVGQVTWEEFLAERLRATTPVSA
jgi:hypothetical protein